MSQVWNTHTYHDTQYIIAYLCKVCEGFVAAWKDSLSPVMLVLETLIRMRLLFRIYPKVVFNTWLRCQMETFSALLAICAENSLVPSEFPSQRPVTRSFDVFFDLRLNKRLSKQSWGWWFETLPCPLWRHLNELSLSKNSAGNGTKL